MCCRLDTVGTSLLRLVCSFLPVPDHINAFIRVCTTFKTAAIGPTSFSPVLHIAVAANQSPDDVLRGFGVLDARPHALTIRRRRVVDVILEQFPLEKCLPFVARWRLRELALWSVS